MKGSGIIAPMNRVNFKCPTCQKQIDWVPANVFRPFCSERCRLIDLGAWADGTYAVPTDVPVDPEDEF